MKTKSFILIIAILFFSIDMYAGDKYMSILMKDGTTIVTDITELPKISFDNGIMSIGTNLLHVDNIVKYTIIDGQADDIVQIDDGAMKIYASKACQGVVTITNAGNNNISLYDVNGIAVPFNIIHSGDVTMIDFRHLPSGIYILSVGSQTIKCKKQ